MDHLLGGDSDDDGGVQDAVPGQPVNLGALTLTSAAPPLQASGSRPTPEGVEDPSAKRQRLIESLAGAAPEQIDALLAAQVVFQRDNGMLIQQLAQMSEVTMRRQVEIAEKTSEENSKVGDLLNSVLGTKKLAQAEYKKVTTKLQELESRINKLLNLQSKLERTNSNLDQIKEGKWPNKLKPFTLKVEVRHHSDPAPDCLKKFSFSIDGPVTVKDVLKSFHEKTTIFYKEIDKFLYEEQIKEIRPLITLDRFVAQCVAPLEEKHSRLVEFGNVLGLDMRQATPAAEKTAKMTKSAAEDTYYKMMGVLAEQHATRLKKVDEQKEAADLRIKKLSEMEPKELLSKSIEAVVKKVVGRGKPSRMDLGVDYAKAYVDTASIMMVAEECIADAVDHSFSGKGGRHHDASGRGRGKGGKQQWHDHLAKQQRQQQQQQKGNSKGKKGKNGKGPDTKGPGKSKGEGKHNGTGGQQQPRQQQQQQQQGSNYYNNKQQQQQQKGNKGKGKGKDAGKGAKKGNSSGTNAAGK